MEFKSKQFVFAGATPMPLDQVLKLEFPGASWNEVRRLVATGKVAVAGTVVRDSRARVSPQAEVALGMTRPRVVPAADPRILYADAHVVVANKPVGIASVDHEAESTSLQTELRHSLELSERKKLPPLRVAHRLDKVTSGVMVFARTQAAQSDLKSQFRAHSTGRLYLAVAHGAVESGTLSFRLVRNRGDGIRGVTDNPNLGYMSVTHVRVREALSRCTLVECQLETGRTHQIRIHLAETGHPLIGEPLYNRNYGASLIPCERTLLHAASLSFVHPVFRNTRRYETPPSPEFLAFLERERKRG